MKLQKKLAMVIVIALVIISSILVEYHIETPFSNLPVSQLASAEPGAVVYVDPSNISGSFGDQFTIDVVVANVSDLYGVDIQFSWDPTILEYVSHTAKIPVEDYPDGILHEPGFLIKDNVSAAEGTYWLAYASMSPAPAFDGTGIAFNMTFHVIGNGSCLLDLVAVELSDSKGVPIGPEVQDGYFEYIGAPKAVFTWWPEIGVVGKPVIFNASESYDPDGDIVRYIWDFGDETPENVTTTPTINHTFTYADVFTVKLTVEDNSSITSDVTHDVRITTSRNIKLTLIKIAPEVPAILVNTTISINCTVENDGTYADENFTISVYYNTTATEWALIDSTQVINLKAGKPTTRTLYWNTTGIEPDRHYIIKANVTAVPYEKDLDDNTLTKEIYITSKITHDIIIEQLNIRAAYGEDTFKLPVILGEDVSISIKLKNNGTAPTEDFVVKIFINNSIINQWNMSLISGSDEWLSYKWEDPEIGSYNVTVKAEVENDTYPNDNLLQNFIHVIATPKLNITYAPLNPRVNENVTLDASNSVHEDPEGQITNYTWTITLPGEPEVTLKGEKVSFIFDKEGNWTVTLTVKDNYGITYSSKRVPSTESYRLRIQIYIPPSGFPLEFIVIPVAIIVVLLIVIVFYRRKRKPPP